MSRSLRVLWQRVRVWLGASSCTDRKLLEDVQQAANAAAVAREGQTNFFILVTVREQILTALDRATARGASSVEDYKQELLAEFAPNAVATTFSADFPELVRQMGYVAVPADAVVVKKTTAIRAAWALRKLGLYAENLPAYRDACDAAGLTDYPHLSFQMPTAGSIPKVGGTDD